MSGPTSRVIRCPVCGGDSLYAASNEYRPFCSARCKNNDFGAWASERYAVPEKAAPDDEAWPDAEPAASPPRPPRASQ